MHWGRHRHVMAPLPWTWQSTKVGAGPTPIETPEGWLLVYHGVLTSCNGFVYSMGVALLDLNEPWRVIARGRDYLLSPQVPYEQVGDVPNVAFPCAALVDGDRISIYYGAADTVTCLAHGYVSGAHRPRPGGLSGARVRPIAPGRAGRAGAPAAAAIERRRCLAALPCRSADPAAAAVSAVLSHRECQTTGGT